MKLQLVCLLTALPVAHGAWAPSIVGAPKRAVTSTTSASNSKTALYMASSNNATDDQQQQQDPLVVPQPQLDPEAFTNDMNRELEDLSSLVEEANAPKSPASYDPTPEEAYSQALKDIKLQDSNPVTKSNKPKGFGKQKPPKTTGNKINIGTQIVEQAQQGNKHARQGKTPRQLIMEAKQAKAQKIQKITPEETRPEPKVPKQEKAVFNPVDQPYLKKPAAEGQQKKSYFPPTPIAKKPDASTVKVTTGKQEPPPKKTYFPPTPMDKKPQVEAKKQDSTPIQEPEVVPEAVESVMASAAEQVAVPKKQKKQKKKMELPKLEIPKIEIPKDTVDQAVGLAKKTGATILDTAKVVAKEGANWANQVKDNLNTTRVEDLDMTYQEAFEKVAQGGRGFIKICSILAGAIKDTVTFFADEVQKNQKTNTTPQLPAFDLKSKATVVDKPKKKVVPKPKPKAASASSYLDQLETKSFVKPRKRLNLRDIVLPKPVLTEDSTTLGSAEEEVVEVSSEDINTNAIPSDTPKAKQELGEIQSKAGSMLGNLWSSASAAMKDVRAKAQVETEKLQASVSELRSKQEPETTAFEEEELEEGTGMDAAPKMRKTQPVKINKKKGPWSFLNKD